MFYKKILKLYEENESEIEISTISNIVSLKNFCKSLKPSKETHYNLLEEWSKPVYDFIRLHMEHAGFVNGCQNQNKTVMIWIAIYELVGKITYSSFLKSEVSPHHSSAYSRNNALIEELEHFLKYQK